MAGRVSGLVGCVVVGLHTWWVGFGIAVVWVVARRLVLGAVVRQATEFRGRTTTMRRSWYFASLGSTPGAAKETRVFGLGGFLADQFRAESVAAIDAATPALRTVRRRAAAGTLLAFAGCTVALVVIAEDARGRPRRDGAGHAPADARRDDGARQRRVLRFEAVRFGCPGQDRPVLDGLDVVLRAGTSTAPVGVNGAGRTTMVSLLARLREPTGAASPSTAPTWRSSTPARGSGRSPSYRRSRCTTPRRRRAPRLGAVEHRDDREGVEAAAAQAGFAAVVTTLPAGRDTVLTRELPGGVDLSGGQWQRLALARALFAVRHGARVLVRGEAAFCERFLEITRGLTTVVISHRFATVRRADSIVVLVDGRITAHGTHHDLVAAAPRWRRQLDLLLLDAYRAEPRAMTGTTVRLVLGSIASTCYPLGHRRRGRPARPPPGRPRHGRRHVLHRRARALRRAVAGARTGPVRTADLVVVPDGAACWRWAPTTSSWRQAAGTRSCSPWWARATVDPSV